jgi:hypothetical protein
MSPMCLTIAAVQGSFYKWTALPRPVLAPRDSRRTALWFRDTLRTSEGTGLCEATLPITSRKGELDVHKITCSTQKLQAPSPKLPRHWGAATSDDFEQAGVRHAATLGGGR